MNIRAIALLLAAPLAGTSTGCFEEHECSCFDYGGVASEITDNHGHELDVPGEDFDEPVDGAYDITGEADHGHEVSFTADQLEVVSGYNSATVESSETDGHTHTVTLDCGCT